MTNVDIFSYVYSIRFVCCVVVGLSSIFTIGSMRSAVPSQTVRVILSCCLNILVDSKLVYWVK